MNDVLLLSPPHVVMHVASLRTIHTPVWHNISSSFFF